jgi:hypothetical protein
VTEPLIEVAYPFLQEWLAKVDQLCQMRDLNSWTVRTQEPSGWCICNETGLDMLVLLCKNKREVQDGIALGMRSLQRDQILQVNFSLPWETEGKSTKPEIKPHFFCDCPGWGSVLALIDCDAIQMFPKDSDENQVNFVVAVQTSKRARTITLRSVVRVRSTLRRSVDLGLLQGAQIEALTTLQPDCGYSLPLQLSGLHSILLFRASVGHSWSELLNREGRKSTASLKDTVLVSGPFSDEKPFYINLQVELTDVDRQAEGSAGWELVTAMPPATLCIHAPLQIENTLLCPINVMISDTGDFELGNIEIRSGDAEHVHFADPRNDLWLAMELPGFVRSPKFGLQKSSLPCTLSLDVLDDQGIPLPVKVDCVLADDGSSHVTFYVTHWILNRTRLPLIYGQV